MRVLRKEGREQFRIWVENLPEHPTEAPPLHFLIDEVFSHGIPGTSEIEPAVYSSKYELAKVMLPHVLEIEAQEVSHECWPGIWDAISLSLFESICPRTPAGVWNPNRIEHYVYDADYKVRHRHRIYGPVTMFRSGGDWTKPFFAGRPCVHGEYEEQIGSRQELAGNITALRVVHALYVDESGENTITGYTSTRKYNGFKKKLPAPGSLRRFTAISDQLKRTYDLVGISYDGFVALLPVEFQKWLDK